MKIKFLMISLLGLISINSLAQVGVLIDAQKEYDDYAAASTKSLLIAKAKQSIKEAKASIDKASVNEKTATLTHTYALKGAIYSALALMDTSITTSPLLAATAKDAIKKAQDADKNGDYKKLITDANNNLATYFKRLGIRQYQAGKYDQAYQSFDNWHQATGDTTALFYSALAASNAGLSNPKFYTTAITDYNKLLTTNFSSNIKIYDYLSKLYLITRDTVSALKTVSAGVVRYPSDIYLLDQEVKFYLMADKENEILGKLKSAMADDPKNGELYYCTGLSYARLGDEAADIARKAKDEATKTANDKISLDYYSQAADYYKKALEIDPKNVDANVNLGNVLLKPAMDTYNQAIGLPPNATQKEYDDMRAKADMQFDLVKPYLQKAVDLAPRSTVALTDLWNYYRGKYDKAHAAENKAKAAELKKQIDANQVKN
jgi:tetratricopeptide (TPR) repeat protein